MKYNKASELLADCVEKLTDGSVILNQRGSYFHPTYDVVCACSHGLMAYLNNPHLKKTVDDGTVFAYMKAHSLMEYEPVVNVNWNLSRDPNRNMAGFSLEDRAHTYALRVGLTPEFNDASHNSVSEVIEKLHEAIQCARGHDD